MVAPVELSSLPVRIPEELIAPLRRTELGAPESGFRGVYRHKRGWHAKVRIPTGRPGRAPLLAVTPEVPRESQAAYLLALWYRDRYGVRWVDVLRARARPHPHWRVRRGAAGWYLSVREFGEWHEVVELRRTRHGLTPWRRHGRDRARWLGRLKAFESKRAAERYVTTWLRVRYGLFAAAVL